VLDLTTVVMGPYATQLLGDLGADVIKVEEAAGDLSRAMGPGPAVGMSGTALNLHRNKRSIVVDLKDRAKRPVVDGLIRWADVMVTNLRPGPLARSGLDYASAVAVKPTIVFCQAQGWPTGTDEGERPAYDDIIQSAAGVADLMERTTGSTALYPSIVADKVCGQMICSSVLAALFERERSGQGQRVEVPMYDSMVAFQLVEHLSGATSVPPIAAPGYARLTTPHRGPKRASDGWITVLPYDTRQWIALFETAGQAHVLDDERFRTAAARTINSDSIYALLGEIISTRTVTEWMRICSELGVAAEPVRSLEDVVAHATSTGRLVTEQHPHVGAYLHIAPPVRFDRTPQNLTRHAPLLGEHTDEIMRELGL
jgi:crotonobetainyl-CoA:carnitine CoA-transferase CaiB-like acyl-CoA transferase